MHKKSLHLIAKILAVATFAATATFAMIPRSTQGVAVADSSESIHQAALYRAHCSRCHGNDGRSNTKEGRKTEADDLTDESVQNMDGAKMARIIRNGKGEMPSNKKLSAAQIASIVNYVRRF